jgi:hypothetical protein
MGLKTMTMTAERPRLLRLAPNTSNQKQQQEGDRLFFMMKSACLCPHCSLVIHEVRKAPTS